MAFNFFSQKRKNEPGPVFINRTYISTDAKKIAFRESAQKDPNSLFICWFPESTGKFREYFIQQGLLPERVMEARYVHAPILQNKTAFFTEHHPLHEKEIDLVRNWEQKEFIVFNALDEPLFNYFGSDKIIHMVRLMGMNEEEPIEHEMVNRAIIRAQEKIASVLQVELAANSQADWMAKNCR